jgi:hypothetical protein
MYRNAGSIELSASDRSRADGEPSLDELAELADRVVQHAGAVRRRYEELATQLGVGDDEVRAGEPAGPAPPGPEPERTSGTSHRDSARLVAFEMALVGDSREATRDYLERTFELEDVDDILDDVFGSPGGDPGAIGDRQRRRLFRRRRG